MIESMACGTPVIATRRGAVPEVIEPGRGGVIVDDWGDAPKALEETVGSRRRRAARTPRSTSSPSGCWRDYLAAYLTLLART